MTDSSGLSRRGFLQAGMLAGAGALAAGALAGCAPQPPGNPAPRNRLARGPHLLARQKNPLWPMPTLWTPATPTSSSSAPATPV